MSHWLNRVRSEPTSAPAVISGAQTWPPQTPLTPAMAVKFRDPNAPDYRYQVNQKCIYERRLPGGSYITAHVQRLQSGFYDSPVIHEERIENVRFVAINFVFHPSRTTFRFKSAEIDIALHHTAEDNKNPLQMVTGMVPSRHTSHDHGTQTDNMPNALAKSTGCLPRPIKPSRPRFLRHAPHLLYGAISPETLNWNFNLAGSLGVSQGPANASIKPSYGVKSSYKVYEMMKIQGSVRTLRSWYGHEYDIEDGEMVWTLEENRLQKSGLPREFTFVMLLTKGSGGFEETGDVRLEIDVHPKVTGRLGATYPSLVTNMHQFRPFKSGILDLDQEIGQVFEPQIKGKGFNFANIASSFDDFVFLPGTTYSTSDSGMPQSPTSGGGSAQQQQAQQQSPQGGNRQQQQSSKNHPALPSGDTTLNLRVFLETSRGSPVPFANQMIQQQLPYLNLKPPSRHPSRTQSPLPPSINGSRNSTRRTITIASTKSLRKRPSRSELSKEYHSSPAESKAQQQPQIVRDRDHPVTRRERTAPTPTRPFSYQEEYQDEEEEYHRDHDHGTQVSPLRSSQRSSPPETLGRSSTEYTTPPSQVSQPVRLPRQSEQI
ncbi:uncharacterized protein Z518_00278 [Rhinocladiella mackenziei CBS 650.93]|uniref:Uncharacterized protein n=1 Tax=Rhinocladiella mackenziei CBS 650.93 TaxID=1442369 RepID=A0A0D2IT40_9EURO|nr:uncharacterized protein Z518_00278 [Rhinocladiella mackenziei CBS 650.93]KIX09199.1 hypothetical protein Z518_00278 [Rhinocladiella mackenziei CBS 650.93]